MLKKFSLGLGLLLLLITLLLAAVLVPAHRQIRAVQDELPAADQLLSALDTTGGPVAVHYLNTASQSGPAGTLGHPGVLLEWGDGSRFLIDTGMPPEDAVAFGRLIEVILDAEPTQTYGSMVSLLGDVADSVRGIGFTHLHTDHTAGLPGLCAEQKMPARVYQPSRQYWNQNHTTRTGLEDIEGSACRRVEIGGAGAMRVPGFPGLLAVSLGGHTPGSTLWATRVGESYLLFSGDITNDKRSLVEDIPKHWLYSTFLVPEDTSRTAALRAWLRSLDERSDVAVFPAHDVEYMAFRLPAFGVD